VKQNINKNSKYHLDGAEAKPLKFSDKVSLLISLEAELSFAEPIFEAFA
jgi:hypothetical protein